MDIENKLDEDFLFYLSFTNTFISRLPKEDADRAYAWLHKLCGQACVGVDCKRNRNIYLSNLILCMQDGKLSEPFTKPPNEVDISDALDVFGPVQPNVQEPEWLDDIVHEGEEDFDGRKDGRTYLATRTLPDGAGAFAYVAVTLAEEEPRWIGGAEGAFEEHMEMKYKEMVPPVYEMEKILAKRRDPKERERVLTFYDAVVQNITDELDGHIEPGQNEAVNKLLEQLVHDLQAKGAYEEYETLSERDRRAQLLILLHDRVTARKQKVAKREEVLDDIEGMVFPKSFFETSMQMQDKFELPAQMWEQAINKAPSKKNMTLLRDNYPIQLIEKFLELLSNHKEEIAIRMQRRHENIVSQMKKELRKEGEAGRKQLDHVQKTHDGAIAMLKDVRAAKERQRKSEQEAAEAMEAQKSATTKLYEQLRRALYDTQKLVEMESEKGKQLTTQINQINEQSEAYNQVTEESIRQTEEANIALMKNIKKMRLAVEQYEKRLNQIREYAQLSIKESQHKSKHAFIV